jgi:hypothetical protein
MRFARILGVVGMVGLMAGVVGCAGTNGAAGRRASEGGELSGKIYTPEELRTIAAMRSNGEGLAAVAKKVGGTRADLRAAESMVNMRRKAKQPYRQTIGIVAAR